MKHHIPIDLVPMRPIQLQVHSVRTSRTSALYSAWPRVLYGVVLVYDKVAHDELRGDEGIRSEQRSLILTRLDQTSVTTYCLVCHFTVLPVPVEHQ